MDKLRMETSNKADEKFKILAKLFPNAVTEIENENGEIERAIDKDILMQEINTKVVEGNEERYQFTWPDKKKSILLSNAPITKTLRPCKEESVNFDTTENLYIEGDNLEVLKLLQETYLGKVKMIYIDPPYNTGNDFVYEDDFVQSMEEYREISGEYDDEGNRLFVNSDSNGRFHTDWLNMVYPRLKIARDLLSDDGVIFISIDDNEQDNLKKICNEIFGEVNFLISMITNKPSQIASENIVSMHEHILVYIKDYNSFTLGDNFKYTISRGTVGNEDQTTPIIEFPKGLNCYNIKDGIYTETRKIEGSKENIENLSPIVVKNGRLAENVSLRAKWRSSNDMRNFFDNNCNPVKAKINGEIIEIYFENDRFNPQIKKRVREKFDSLYLKNKRGSKRLEELQINYFDNPKDVNLIKYLIERATKLDSIVLDFFSGSSTTAHSIMELNAEDGGNRKFIMVQIPEKINEKSSAFKEGYKNICEIGKERIRRAGKKIIEENKDKEGIEKLDIGFRVLKCDSSNMKDVYYEPEDYDRNDLLDLVDNIKEDRTGEDLLFQVMLELGILLSSKIEEEIINGRKVFNVENGFLYACFESNIDEEVVRAIANKKPYYAIFRDSGMDNDSVMTNFEQIFISISPSTVRKVL